MGTTVSTLITRARRRLNETSTTFHSDEDLIAYADEAQNYIAGELRLLEGIDSQTIDASKENPEQYSYPSDCLAIRRITLDGYDLFRTDFMEIKEAEIDTNDLTGNPTFWYEWNNIIYLYPIPGDGDDGETLKIFYYKKPSSITKSTDTLDIGTEFDSAVVCYMVYLACIKDDLKDKADYMMSECNAKLALIKRHKAEDKLDRPPRFRLSDNLRMRDALNTYRSFRLKR